MHARIPHLSAIPLSQEERDTHLKNYDKIQDKLQRMEGFYLEVRVSGGSLRGKQEYKILVNTHFLFSYFLSPSFSSLWMGSSHRVGPTHHI